MALVQQLPAAMADEVQAWAAVGAILAGFASLFLQRWIGAWASGRAAGHLARHSLDFVTSRLEALVDPSQPIEFALRGARAAEMIEVLRELDISTVPPKLIDSLAVIRSAVYAVNSRIDEVLEGEGKRRLERRTRLYSAGRTLSEAYRAMETLQAHYMPWNRRKFAVPALTARMKKFLSEADAARKPT